MMWIKLSVWNEEDKWPPKKCNLIICREGENYKTSTYAVDNMSVMFIFADKLWYIQAMNIWLQRLNNVPYYLWMIGADNILDYYIAGDILNMSLTLR